MSIFFGSSSGFNYLAIFIIGIILMQNIFSVKRTEKDKYRPILITAIVISLFSLIINIFFLDYYEYSRYDLIFLVLVYAFPKLIPLIILGVYITLTLIQLFKLKEEAPKYKVIIFILSATIMILGLFHAIVLSIFYEPTMIKLDTIDKVINVIITLPTWIVSIALIAVFIIWNIFDKQEIAINKNYKRAFKGVIIALPILLAAFILNGIITGRCLEKYIYQPSLYFSYELVDLDGQRGYYVTETSNRETIYKYNFKAKKIIIPSKYENLPVLGIRGGALLYRDYITSITIPNSIISIGDEAFHNCSNLTSIEIPNSVASIGNLAFSCCNSLKSIEIPNSVTSIGYGAFSGCSSLENVYYKGTIEDWCKISFSDSDSNPMSYASHIYMLDEKNEYEEVTEIVIPETITKIGNYQFYRFSKLTSIEIPNSVTSIGESAFSGCSGLTSIIIPNTVTFIGNYVFNGCNNLIIYCEVNSEPDGWDPYWSHSWNSDNRPVVWGYKK